MFSLIKYIMLGEKFCNFHLHVEVLHPMNDDFYSVNVLDDLINHWNLVFKYQISLCNRKDQLFKYKEVKILKIHNGNGISISWLLYFRTNAIQIQLSIYSATTIRDLCGENWSGIQLKLYLVTCGENWTGIHLWLHLVICGENWSGIQLRSHLVTYDENCSGIQLRPYIYVAETVQLFSYNYTQSHVARTGQVFSYEYT